MGGNIGLYWLQKARSSWKSKYIKSFITFGTPWIGAIKSVRLVISGDNINLYVVNPLMLTYGACLMSDFWVLKSTHLSPSTIFLFPSIKHWNNSDIIVSALGKNYTVRDYQALFVGIGYDDGFDIFLRLKDEFDPKEAPNVETHIIYGDRVDTPKQYIYSVKSKNWYDKVPVIVNGNGDGTVNLESLTAPFRLWKQKSPLIQAKIDHAEHLEMLSDARVIDYIENLIRSYS
ncbi:hypothetical protein ACOME3_000998 [Neoechinorhynchus agilis]